MPPEFALLDVGEAELPVLVRLVDAGEEPLALLLLGQMQEELDDPRAVAVEMPFQIHDGAVSVVPDLLSSRSVPGRSFAAQDLADARGRSALPRNRSG